MEPCVVTKLEKQRKRLLQSYVIHVAWFTAMIVTAVTQGSKTTVATAILLALITVPPVIGYATAVHRTCRSIDPRAKTIGLVPMLIMTVLFTPFESGLVAPARNLWVSGNLLREARLTGPATRRGLTQASGADTMDNLFRVVSAAELALATASGVVPRCPSDERSNCVHLNHRNDVETVANLYFTPDEAPVALEVRRSDIRDVSFAPATEAKPFGQVTLVRPNILLEWVVAVHPLHVVQCKGAPAFKFAAGPQQIAQADLLCYAKHEADKLARSSGPLRR